MGSRRAAPAAHAVAGRTGCAARVGAGWWWARLGVDAEYLAGLGFRTTGFDVASTAMARAGARALERRRLPRRRPARAPRELNGAFDLVVEIITVQALPNQPRAAARGDRLRWRRAARCSLSGDPRRRAGPGPPFPLTREQWSRSRAAASSSSRWSACRCPTRPRSGAGRRCSTGPPTSGRRRRAPPPSWRCGSRTTP